MFNYKTNGCLSQSMFKCNRYYGHIIIDSVATLTFLNVEILLFSSKYNRLLDNLSNPQQNSEKRKNHQISTTERVEKEDISGTIGAGTFENH